MKPPRTWHISVAILLSLQSVGCVLEEPEGDDVIEWIRCVGCGRNGLSLPAAREAPAALAPAQTAAFGLLNMSGEPAALCDVATLAPTECDINNNWDAWRGAGPERDEIFEYLVKVALDDGFTVRAGMDDFDGEFGLANVVAGNHWTSDAQEMITGGFALLTNVMIGVDLCLATPYRNGCPIDYRYQELSAFGNLPDGTGRIIVGSPYAYDPQANFRTCSGGASSCPTMEDDHGYRSTPCTYSGEIVARVAHSCASGGRSWNNPVTAFTLIDPGTYYSGTRTEVTIY